MTIYRLDISANKSELARRASSLLAEQITSTLTDKNRCQVALSGGSTPKDAYSLLAQKNIPWGLVDVFLGDERWVPPDDKLSNSLMIRESFLSKMSGEKASFYPVPTTGECKTPEDSALAFSKLLQSICDGSPPIFDLVLLGLGDDGHTASLFPGTTALNIVDKYAAASVGNGQQRVTLTSPVFNVARKVFFLVSGPSKQTALKRLLDSSESFHRTPARLVQPSSEVIILADEDASLSL